MPSDRDPSTMTTPRAATRPASPARDTPHRRYRLRLPGPGQADPARRGLYAGEPEACRRSLARFLPSAAHLGLLLAVVLQYKIEYRAFRIVLGVAVAAFPIHYALPYRWKRPAFFAASLVGLAWVFGPATTAAVGVVGAALVAACAAPVPWPARASVVAALGLALGLGRAGACGDLSAIIPSAAWPVLGSMFAFRMILYLYEWKHAEGRPSAADAASYFCMLPNFAFLHFPVVDYRALRRTYFAAEVHALHRAGLRMMVRGVAHLLIFRICAVQYFVSAEEVHDPRTLLAHVVFNYLKYLHVSGQFHLACGMLHLFGFGLPETHHDYLLASSFTDYWRRINIYWKDFMVRVVFNPVAFRLKGRPRWLVLAASTACVFAATWFLHALQSFWLRGTWGFSVPDLLFWGILGALVMVNVQLDARARPARRSDPASAWRGGLVHAAKVAGTFATIATLWSLWSSPSVGDWASMVRRGLP